MTHWYVKDLSKLTGISVQTLHHYDRIDLLGPSLRLSNGYRVYSEKDLLQLQQIIALKFFGFELSKIKLLLMGNAGALEHFSVQAQFLEQKANSLLEASKVLKSIISKVSDDKSIPWETIFKLIEVSINSFLLFISLIVFFTQIFVIFLNSSWDTIYFLN